MDEETLKVIQRLQGAGVPLGQWQEMNEATVQVESLEQTKEMLVVLRNMLQGQLDQSVLELDEAMQKLERIQHGGGH